MYHRDPRLVANCQSAGHTCAISKVRIRKRLEHSVGLTLFITSLILENQFQKEQCVFIFT